ncbi:hypothetical protein [Streptomyces uncialis]|uniref:hypothetical protein n=1 Tax=Streptomyces uncialis TaxID=1048205 RepID=UPI0034113A35
MSSRSILRRATLLTAAIGGVLAPAGAAVASDGAPDRSIIVSDSESPAKVEVVQRDREVPGDKVTATQPPRSVPASESGPRVADGKPADKKISLAPRGGVAAGEATATPAPAPRVADGKPAEKRISLAPRGGVAAGERVAAEGGGSTAVAGSAAGLVMLAGAGTIMLRRRAAHRNG